MEWKTGTIKPIHKKGDRKEVCNYRGITLTDRGYKIYAEIVRKRLEKELVEKEVLGDTQMGYREGKGTAEAIYVLKEIVRKAVEKERGKVFVGFADTKAAFDRLKRERIWERLRKKGVNRSLIERMRSLFRGTIDEFGVLEGVRQGCPLSPTLFNIALADLEEEMEKVQGSGTWLGGKKRRIRTISYADDIALIAEEEEVMKDMLKRLKRWIAEKGLELNAKKTKIMMFRKGGGRKKEVSFK